MCVIVWKPKDKVLPESTFRKCWTRNPDGGGFMLARGGKLRVYKPFFKLEDMVRTFYRIVKPEDVAVVHFRIRTSGTNAATGCHPHWVSDGVAVVHNGILPISSDKHPEWSDTMAFTNLVLKKLPIGWEESGSLHWLIEQALGSGNKLCLLRADGATYIFNRDKGTDRDGLWFSNTHWDSYQTVTSSEYQARPLRATLEVDGRAPWEDNIHKVRELCENLHEIVGYRYVSAGGMYLPVSRALTDAEWELWEKSSKIVKADQEGTFPFVRGSGEGTSATASQTSTTQSGTRTHTSSGAERPRQIGALINFLKNKYTVGVVRHKNLKGTSRLVKCPVCKDIQAEEYWVYKWIRDGLECPACGAVVTLEGVMVSNKVLV